MPHTKQAPREVVVFFNDPDQREIARLLRAAGVLLPKVGGWYALPAEIIAAYFLLTDDEWRVVSDWLADVQPFPTKREAVASSWRGRRPRIARWRERLPRLKWRTP